MLSRNICHVLCYLPQIVEATPSIIGLFRHFLASCRMNQGVRTVLGHSFCSNMKTPNNVANSFLTSGIWFFQGSFVCSVFGVVLLVGVIVRPRKSISVAPKWQLRIVSLRPASWMHLKVALRLAMRLSASLTAMPVSSTYWAHWSALKTLSRYSLMKPENADRARLRPCAKRL